MRYFLPVSLLALLVGCSARPDDWRAALDQQLPILGHRNWIVVVDSAYPWQTAPGIQTFYTSASQIEVVQAVLDATRSAPHVDPIIYIDEELTHVPDDDAPGVQAYRKQLDALLNGLPVNRLPHEQIIARLDQAGNTFRVLALKTDMTLPYTSVFIELYCGYWDAPREQRLRQLMKPTP
jgi:hypothetical protein